ncbi:MAG: hypothetical protein LBQ12_04350, partial [Deltaproteobacteria bacterium]|nr:hypothetical protein [Deltaproteobacteria bacterium]
PEEPPAPELPPGPPEEGAQIRLPPGDGDLSFLEGCWKSEAGLSGTMSGNRLHYVYCFGTDGAAQVRVEVLDGSGKTAFYCPATGKAEMKSGVLTIKDSGGKCPADEPDFAETTVVCSPVQGKDADCVIQSQDGEALTTKFTYQGAKR